MSFSKETKEALCRDRELSYEQKTALIYGMALFSKNFSANAISMTTESRPAAMTFCEELAALTGVIVDLTVKLTRRGGENSLYYLSVPDKTDCRRVFDFFGHDPSRPSLRINRANIDADKGTSFFLRGVFLVCGSVTDPDKDYHLEFSVPHKNLASDLERIIGEIEEINAEPKTVMRKGSYIVYIKGSDNIEDMLTYIGAPMSALNIMQSRMVKSVRNRVNRRINSETANLNKTAEASARQLIAIELIRDKRGLESLPDDLREIALLRLEHPEYNLRELGNALTVPISRSGANHRIQRLMAAAEELRGK